MTTSTAPKVSRVGYDARTNDMIDIPGHGCFKVIDTYPANVRLMGADGEIFPLSYKKLWDLKTTYSNAQRGG